jgi:3-oxoacyl-[acyl-carrier protein] reductase
MRTLEGTVALVTGGSRGIGREICLRLAGLGSTIVLHYHRNAEAAAEVASQIGREVTLVQADIGSPTEIEAMFQKLHGVRLNFLINNAGVWKNTPLGSSSIERVNEILDANLRAPFLVTQFALPLLQDGGRIVNISSVAGRIGVAAGRSLYGAAKAGVDSLTKSWALELAPRRILVNSVAPGYVATDMTAEYFSDKAMMERALSSHPLGRMCTPGDVADLVAFLCSDGAQCITGQSINVSGGSVI